jgi:hypothetical protein
MQSESAALREAATAYKHNLFCSPRLPNDSVPEVIKRFQFTSAKNLLAGSYLPPKFCAPLDPFSTNNILSGASMRLLSLLGALVLTIAFGITSASAAGNHNGEAANLKITITFLEQEGITTTSSAGTYFDMGGTDTKFRDDLIYPSLYWGTFPAYWGNAGDVMHFKVDIANTETKGGHSYKISVEAISNVLTTEGGLGMQIGNINTWTVTDLGPGQSTTVFGEITFPEDGTPEGLDVTRIRVLHLNNSDNPDAGLIKVATGVWCPPASNNG